MWEDKKVPIPNAFHVPTHAPFTLTWIMALVRCLVCLDIPRKWFEIRPKLDANSKRIKYSPKNEKRCSRGLLCVRGSSEGKQIDCIRWFGFAQNSFFIRHQFDFFYVSDINTHTQSASAGSSPPCGAREEPPAVYYGVTPYLTSVHILHPPQGPILWVTVVCAWFKMTLARKS